MTISEPEVVAWSWAYRGRHMATTDYSQALELAEPPYPTEVEPLIRLADYQRLQADHERLQAECEELKRALSESRANDLTAMGYLNQIRGLVGAADLPDMVRRCEKLQAECENLRSIISDLKDWDCDVSGGFLSIPVDLRRRMQEAIDGAMQEVT